MDKRQLEAQFAEAVAQRDRCTELYRETRDMAHERETPQGKQVTMQSAMRYKAQAEVWDREVNALAAQLKAAKPIFTPPSPEQFAAVDSTMGALVCG